VIFAAFLAIRIYREPEVASKKRATTQLPSDFRAQSEALLIKAFTSFGLSDTVEPGYPEGERAGGATYQAFRQGWPQELPFLAFVSRLNELVRAESLSCDCLEAQRDGILDCFLIARGAIAAKITLKADPATNFVDRELALVYENLTSLTTDEISSLLKSGMNLSYIAGPETQPSSKIRDLFTKKGVIAILRLPASKKGWQKLANSGRFGKGGRKTKTGVPDKSLIDEALQRHPTTRLICFDFADGTDWNVVEAVSERARAKKIALLITPDQPQDIINAGGKAKIQIFTAQFDKSLVSKSLGAMKNELMRELITGGPEKGSIACPDTAGLTLKNLWEFKTYFEKLGVRFRPLMKIAEPFEGPP
jgi:hypothetical protein